MRVNFKKTICLTLAALTILGASGCGESGGGTVSLDDLYIPTYTDNGESVRTLALIPPDFSNREQVEQYKAVGFNAAIYPEDFVQAEDVLKYGENSTYIQGLKLCEEYGLDVIIKAFLFF